MVSPDVRFALIASRFNYFIVEHLVNGALDGLRRHGGKDAQASVYWVPGAWEIPVVAAHIAREKKANAILALGAVIRGSTPHFDYVASEATKGVANLALETGIPIAMGILTTDTIEQAIERAGTKHGNKGYEAACCAIEMLSLLGLIESL